VIALAVHKLVTDGNTIERWKAGVCALLHVITNKAASGGLVSKTKKK
jgi:hypothetical protein